MKILIVNTHDIEGGAARAAYRLHCALLEKGIESQMLVQNKKSDDFTVKTVADSKLERIMAFLRPKMEALPLKLYKNRKRVLFSSAWVPSCATVRKINAMKPDIVHLHWICNGVLRIEDLAKIEAPIVWSLHDMWAFTGGCHYDKECGKYLAECGVCSVLGSSVENDLSRKVFERKRRTYFKMDRMYIVGLSKWLHKTAKQSTLLAQKRHINLPNPIDTTLFKPVDRIEARKLWRLPQDKKLVLFGAVNPLEDSRKGFFQLSEALRGINRTGDTELVVFGSSRPENAPEFGFETYYLGSLSDDVSLVSLYSAVDVVVVPSLQENLSNTIMESLSCGTPVVAFDTGGNSDMIEHKKNGYLAKPFDAADLAKGIEWVLESDDYADLCRRAREKVLEEFDAETVAREYIKLYESILNG